MCKHANDESRLVMHKSRVLPSSSGLGFSNTTVVLHPKPSSKSSVEGPTIFEVFNPLETILEVWRIAIQVRNSLWWHGDTSSMGGGSTGMSRMQQAEESGAKAKDVADMAVQAWLDWLEMRDLADMPTHTVSQVSDPAHFEFVDHVKLLYALAGGLVIDLKSAGAIMPCVFYRWEHVSEDWILDGQEVFLIRPFNACCVFPVSSGLGKVYPV
jgi:hypothetical protein